MHSIELNSLAADARKYWPMHIAEGPNQTGFRIGGLPPDGVEPMHASERTQYFGTFPVSGYQDYEMSIFCSFEYLDPASQYMISRNIKKPLGVESGVVECVFHMPSKPTKDSCFVSELRAYSLSVGDSSMDDPEDERGGVPHKIGGIAFTYAKERKASSDLLNSGYIHVLQFGYPGRADCKVKGLWPFSNYRFHLYLKHSNECYEYKILLN